MLSDVCQVLKKSFQEGDDTTQRGSGEMSNIQKNMFVGTEKV